MLSFFLFKRVSALLPSKLESWLRSLTGLWLFWRLKFSNEFLISVDAKSSSFSSNLWIVKIGWLIILVDELST